MTGIRQRSILASLISEFGETAPNKVARLIQMALKWKNSGFSAAESRAFRDLAQELCDRSGIRVSDIEAALEVNLTF